MRWAELFADLEGQARSLERAELEAEVADRTRAELARIRLLDRLRAYSTDQVSLLVTGGLRLRGTLERVGPDWLLITDPGEVLVPLAALTLVLDLGPRSVDPGAVGVVSSRLGLASAVRALALDRAAVTVTLCDGATITGTPDRVGADHFDLSIHAGDQAPRPGVVRSRAAVLFGAVAAIRRVTPAYV